MKTPERHYNQNSNILTSSDQIGDEIRVSNRLQRGTRNLKQGKYSHPNQTSTAGTNSRRVSNGGYINAAGASGLWANADLIPHSSIQTIDSEQEQRVNRNSTQNRRLAH